MGRSVSAALAAAIASNITQVGYLAKLEVPGSPELVARGCDLGDFYWPQVGSPPSGGDLFAATALVVSGVQLGLDAPSPESASISLQNLDNSMSALLLNVDTSLALVTLWQVARGLTMQEDAALIGEFSISGVEIGLREARIGLTAYSASALFAPRKKVNAENGLANGVAPGTRIPWAGEVLVLEEGNDG